MSIITLAWRNYADASTLSGGSYLAALPLTNLQNRQVQKVARTTDATNASTKFVIDQGSAKTVGVIALIVHNISAVGKYRIRANTSNSFASPLYDSGWVDVWTSGAIPEFLLEWEDDNFWLGTMTPEERAGYQSPLIHIPTTQQVFRYWQVEIDDTTNAAGYVNFGRLFISSVWQPEYNYEVNNTLGYTDSTLIDTSLSGAEYFDIRPKFRTFNFELFRLSATEAYGSILDLQRVAGTSGEVLCVPDYADTDNAVRRSFVGRLSAITEITQPMDHFFTAKLQIKELL